MKVLSINIEQNPNRGFIFAYNDNIELYTIQCFYEYIKKGNKQHCVVHNFSYYRSYYITTK